MEIENSAILRGNRSACYIALKEYAAAATDAQMSIELDKSYAKGYFRLSVALKGLGKVAEAISVAKVGLTVDPGNLTLRKIVSSAENEGPLSTKKSTKPDAPRLNSVDIDLSPIELAMLSHIRQLIKRIQNGDFDRGVANLHMLQGTFAELCAPTCRDILFPGLSHKLQASLPGSLRELLKWKNMEDIMTQQMYTMAKSAASILEGVRVRGAQRGDVMDTVTESVLAPQIAQETFGREVIAVVREINSKAASDNARCNLAIAIRPDGGVTRRQVDDGVMLKLFQEGRVAIQDYFLGKQWSHFVLKDIIRYVSDEKMSEVKFSNIITPTSSTQTVKTSNRAYMAWLETDAIDVFYPTLAAVVKRLHDLPYEFNGKNVFCCEIW